MAELIAGVQKTRLTLNGDVVLVGRHSEDGSFTPDIDLAAFEGGRTVSRRHARIFRRDGQWVLKVESTTTNATVIGGRVLTTGEEAVLKDGDELLLGKVPLIFRAGVEAPAPNPEATLVGATQATAELRAEGRTFPLSVAEGRQLSLGRHSDDRAYRPDIDLGDLTGGKTVSRRHGLLYRRGDQWLLKVEAAVTNPTILNGTQLALGQEAELKDNDQLQLGRVVVTFHQLPSIPSVGPELIELSVDPIQVTTEAGQEIRTTVTIINHTGHVEWFTVAVEGIPAEWYKVYLPDGTLADPPRVQLFHTPAHTASPAPDAIGKLRIYFKPPKDCQSWAGVHQLVISATTQGTPQMRCATSARLVINRFESLEASIEPDSVPRASGQFRIKLHNHGNDVTTVTIETAGDGLAYAWDRPQTQLSNCASDELALKVRVLKRHWLGPPRDYPFGLTLHAGTQKDELFGHLLCQPRIPWWLQTLYGRVAPLLFPILFVIALVGAAFLLLRPPEIKTFKADPAVVTVGTPVSLSWQIDRAKSVSIDPSSGNEQLKPDTGKLSVQPTATTKYTLTARNLVGISSSRSVDVVVNPAPVKPQILVFTAAPTIIAKEGDPVTLNWKVQGATKVTITPAGEIPDVSAGQATVHPKDKSTVYTLTATNEAGSTTQTVTITINPPTIVAFTANPDTNVVAGSPVKLSWTAQNFTRLTIKASNGNVANGKPDIDLPPDATNLIVNPTQNTQYTLTAANAGGTDVKTVDVTITPVTITYFRADPPTIPKGQSAQLTWNVVGATSITIQPDVGPVAPGQTSVPVAPQKTTEYTLTASAGGQQKQAKTTVTVGLGPVKIDFINAASTTITRGDSTILAFSVQNAKQIIIKGSDGSVPLNTAVSQPSYQGNVTVSPTKTTIYILTASNDSGPQSQSVTVTVVNPTPTPAPPPPTPKPGG